MLILYHTSILLHRVRNKHNHAMTPIEQFLFAAKIIQIGLQNPQLSDVQRCLLEMEIVRGFSEADVAGSLILTAKEYRRERRDALEVASVMPAIKPPAQAQGVHNDVNGALEKT